MANPKGNGGAKKGQPGRKKGKTTKYLPQGWMSSGIEDKVLRMGGSAAYLDWVKREHPQEFIRFTGRLLDRELKEDLFRSILAFNDTELRRKLELATKDLPDALLSVIVTASQAQQAALPTVIEVEAQEEE